jgi:GalNAc-alpha-(1->4)-GalNAc-alpha-(1->3)-diNAcBac-PP-undecaprenol alpha-1,4-N-acetyl-D-galactosaminyltransferase
MKKIILVIPTLSQGGAERVMSELANEWACKGHIVKVILLAESDLFYILNPKIELINFGFVLHQRNIFFKILNQIIVAYKLRKQIKNSNSDFILSFMAKYNLFLLIVTAFIKVNLFISDRDNPKAATPRLIEIGRSLFYKYSKGIIAQTHLAKEILHTKTKNNNIRVIPNPIKEILVDSEIPKEKIILNVGRLVPEKGQHYLIEMMAKITQNDWKLIILGDGPLRVKLQNQINNLNLNNRVILEGVVDNVDEWLNKSSLFALSSVSEGFPNALLEAMQSGLACVSFDCDTGPRDIIVNGDNGYLVPLKDVDLFAQTIQKLIENIELRNQIGTNAKKISKNLNIGNVAQQYLNFCLQK